MSDIQVGDRVRVIEGTGPYPEGTEFTVERIVPSAGIVSHSNCYVTGYVAPGRTFDAGIWRSFVQKIQPEAVTPEISAHPLEESLAAISNTLISIGWALDRLVEIQDAIYAQGARR